MVWTRGKGRRCIILCNSTGGDVLLLWASHPPTLLVLTITDREIHVRGAKGAWGPPVLKKGGAEPPSFFKCVAILFSMLWKNCSQKASETLWVKNSKFSWGCIPPDPPRWLLALVFEAQLTPTTTVVVHSPPLLIAMYMRLHYRKHCFNMMHATD